MKKVFRVSLILIILFTWISSTRFVTAEDDINSGFIKTWKLKYIISDKVLDAIAVKAKENWEIPSKYSSIKCAREYVRLNLIFATWGSSSDGKIWIQSYKLDDGLVQLVWGPDSPHDELIGEKYQPEEIITEFDGAEQHYHLGDTWLFDSWTGGSDNGRIPNTCTELGTYNVTGKEINLFLTTCSNNYVGKGVFSLQISPGICKIENDYILGPNKKRGFSFIGTSETNGTQGGSPFSQGTMHVSGGVIWGQSLKGSVGNFKTRILYTDENKRDIWFALFWLSQLWVVF